ncbi:MAG: PhzF family phenazine biosynthesis protein [Actinomycetota bacterium]|nr:PhzF family phenazine biosynthesis protein [Actinomycetota bacterium]
MAGSTHPYTVLDVFTDTPLTGNPLAVFTAGELIPSRLMQAVARELHLSETVFLLPGDGEADATVRIFTPQSELPFAGHPVLGAAFVVGAEHELERVRLRTGAGIVPVTLMREHGAIVFGEMEQPLPSVCAFDRAGELLSALGVDGSLLPVEAYTNGPTHVMVGVADVSGLGVLEPDLAAIAKLGPLGIDCFAACDPGVGSPAPGAGSPADVPARVRCRVFCPGLGVPEDPATGSAAGPLALHLARHGRYSPGGALEIIQGAEIGRPSRLVARVEGPPDSPARITVGGSAVVVAEGWLRAG